MTADEIERLGYALSKVIQHRYCWLAAHAVRGLFLRLADTHALPQLPLAYSFSLEDERNGVPPIPLEFILRPLMPAPEPMAQTEDGIKFDHAYIRDINPDGAARKLPCRGAVMPGISQDRRRYHQARSDSQRDISVSARGTERYPAC